MSVMGVVDSVALNQPTGEVRQAPAGRPVTRARRQFAIPEVGAPLLGQSASQLQRLIKRLSDDVRGRGHLTNGPAR